jgi:hypothetical protein
MGVVAGANGTDSQMSFEFSSIGSDPMKPFLVALFPPWSNNVRNHSSHLLGFILKGEDPSPVRIQIVDIPPIKPMIEEYRFHGRVCECVDKRLVHLRK